MKPPSLRASALALLLLGLGTHPSVAHLTYPAARNFGDFDGTNPQAATISGQSSKLYGWADGADADWARQDDQRYFQFTLLSSATVTISVVSLSPTTFYPAFTIFSGLGHAATDPEHPDFDGAATTQAYLNSLPAPARKGSFNALGDLTIGNDNAANNYVGSLVTLLYQGNAADGAAGAGINGDGLRDGNLTASFALPAGAYTLAISGADAAATSTANAGFNATVSVAPEPGVSGLLAVGAGVLALRLRQRGGRLG